MSPRERRKKRLIEPRLQLRFSMIFLTSAALAALVQSITFSFLLMKTADRLPNDGLELKSSLMDVLAASFFVTLAILVPLTMAVGITATHKVVGPLYRFRVFLTDLAAGRRPADCKIREGDELQDLCALLNQATEPLRQSDPVQTDRPFEKEAA